MKIGIKRSLLFFLCAVVALLSVGCNGTYVPGNKPTQDPSGGDSSGGNTPGITVDEELVFTVTLNLPETLSSFALRSMQAKWTNTESNNGASYVASFNDDGVAEISGLDGEYKVTLGGLPEGYTYNPNIYSANNDNRNISIRLYKLVATDSSKSGSDWYNDIVAISETGAYRATLTEENFENGIRFRYVPGYAGNYSIESMIDITENKLNPYLDMHGGSSEFVNPIYETMDGGGAENTYTKNFRWEISIIHIGNAFNFRIYATTLDEGVFPVNVDFILERDGEFTSDDDDYDVIEVIAKHDFEAAKETAFEGISGRFTYFAYYGSNNGLLNGNLVKLFDDGYYYIVDENGEKYKRLYARIGKDCECMSTDDDSGLLFPMVRLNKILVYDEESGTNRCYNYKTFIREQYGENLYQGDTYPVTEELKLFLQRYSVSQRFFNDGNGVGEIEYDDNGNGTSLYKSTERNQWLWACGYYA